MPEWNWASGARNGATRHLLTRRVRLGAAALAVIVAGCGEDPPSAPEAPFASAMLTPDVASTLNTSGRFPRAPIPPQPYAQIDYVDAERIASAYMRSFGSIAYDDWARDHGGPIDPRALQPCGQTMFARSAYEPTNEILPVSLRNFTAGHFFIYFCGSGRIPQVLVAVSAPDNNLQVLADGRLKFPDEPVPHAIFSQGVPQFSGGQAVVSAERAVALSAIRTGQRVAAMPLLVMPPFNRPPSLARWHIGIETPIGVMYGPARAEEYIDEVFVGRELGVFGPVSPLIGTDIATTSDADELLPAPDPETGTLVQIRMRLMVGVPRMLQTWTTLSGAR